jgi:hypothetical protein
MTQTSTLAHMNRGVAVPSAHAVAHAAPYMPPQATPCLLGKSAHSCSRPCSSKRATHKEHSTMYNAPRHMPSSVPGYSTTNHACGKPSQRRNTCWSHPHTSNSSCCALLLHDSPTDWLPSLIRIWNAEAQQCWSLAACYMPSCRSSASPLHFNLELSAPAG